MFLTSVLRRLNREQVQEVQQQIENVVLKASEMEELLARAKQAGDMEEVKYLRNQPAGAAVQVKG